MNERTPEVYDEALMYLSVVPSFVNELTFEQRSFPAPQEFGRGASNAIREFLSCCQEQLVRPTVASYRYEQESGLFVFDGEDRLPLFRGGIGKSFLPDMMSAYQEGLSPFRVHTTVFTPDPAGWNSEDWGGMFSYGVEYGLGVRSAEIWFGKEGVTRNSPGARLLVGDAAHIAYGNTPSRFHVIRDGIVYDHGNIDGGNDDLVAEYLLTFADRSLEGLVHDPRVSAGKDI